MNKELRLQNSLQRKVLVQLSCVQDLEMKESQ